MTRICLVITRFRNNKKEAISKNFINLAETFSKDQTLSLSTISPTPFPSEDTFNQNYFAQEQDYASLSSALLNLYKSCQLLKKNYTHYDAINIHIASPVETFLIWLLLPKVVLQKTSLSIWQSYLSFQELKDNRIYYLKNLRSYLHVLIANSFLSAFLYNLSLDSFKQIIVHNNFQRGLLQQHCKSTISLIPNAVFPLHNYDKRIFSTDTFTLLYIGHTKASKGVDIVLRLIAELRTLAKVKLVLASSGFGGIEETLAQIHALGISEQVTFKDDIDVEQELLQAHMLIVPLRTCIGTSLSPNVIVEAISLGTPVVTSRFPELNELLASGQHGLSIDINDIKTSVEIIYQTLISQEKMTSISQAQINFFRNELTFEKFSQKYKNQIISSNT